MTSVLRSGSGLIESLNSFAGSGGRLFAETQLFNDGCSRFSSWRSFLCLGNDPRSAVVSCEPRAMAGAFYKLHFDRVPEDGLAIVVGLVHQVASDGRAGADAFVGDGFFAASHAGKEVLNMVDAFVKADACVLEEHFFGFVQFVAEFWARILLF